MSAACGSANRPSTRPCNIGAEVKNRNGHPRWWCYTHGAPAWGPGGVQLDQCGGAASAQEPDDVLRLDPTQFAGGVGLWGAVQPVFNTGPEPSDWGVHVHARARPGGHKLIDQTYPRVVLEAAGIETEVDSQCATAYVVASVFGLELKRLCCPRCGGAHLDAEEFATSAHRKHQCNHCGRHFFDPDAEPSISNPLAGIAATIGGNVAPPIQSHQVLSLEQSDFTGGIAIWGSNQALLWTTDRPEEAGVHVHAWSGSGELVLDDTFGSVSVDGLPFDPDQCRVLMVQQSLRFLRGRVVDLSCPSCGLPHFDRGPDALLPHSSHTCLGCREVFFGRNRHRLVVANPLVAAVRRLRGN